MLHLGASLLDLQDGLRLQFQLEDVSSTRRMILLVASQESWYAPNLHQHNSQEHCYFLHLRICPGARPLLAETAFGGDCLGLPAVQPELCSGINNPSGLDFNEEPDPSRIPEDLLQVRTRVQVDRCGDRLGLPSLGQDRPWSPGLSELVPGCLHSVLPFIRKASEF